MASKRKKKSETPPSEPKEKTPPPPPETFPLEKRTLVILTIAFLAGGALMTIEIVGGRIIAARFGSHVFVWGGLIGIFMGALSLGYFFGGRLADRFPTLPAMGSVLCLTGGTVLLLPAVSGPVCGLVADLFFTKNVELANRWNPTFAILVLFSAPALLLGSISPFTVRLLARDVGTLARVTARVYALNALGSIAGTILTAFFLMSVMGNTAILIVTAVLLLVTGAGTILSGLFGFFESGAPKAVETPST
ncbi:MAG: fused MFS/spermidine synthase [Planctomycetota bacterium]|jgi:MFS family permease